MKPYQVLPGSVIYFHQEPFKRVIKASKVTNTGMSMVNKMPEWCNRFAIAQKLSGTVQLCLDTAILNKAFTRPIHRGTVLNDVLHKLANAHHMALIDAGSEYHKLKLDKRNHDT